MVGGESKKIVGLLNSFRCSRVKYVELGNREHLDKKELADVFNALVSHSKNNFMESLLMSGTRDTLDLSAVHPFKLAGAVENLDALIIENCKLTEEQLNTLVLHLAELPTRLGRLSFPGVDLKSDHDSYHHDHYRLHHQNPSQAPVSSLCLQTCSPKLWQVSKFLFYLAPILLQTKSKPSSTSWTSRTS